MVQIQNFWFNDLFSGKSQQLFGQISGSPGRVLDFFQVWAGIQILPGVLEGKFRMPQNHPQHIVEIMGHSSCQPAHGFHFLCLGELALEFFPFHVRKPGLCDIPDNPPEPGGTPA